MPPERAHGRKTLPWLVSTRLNRLSAVPQYLEAENHARQFARTVMLLKPLSKDHELQNPIVPILGIKRNFLYHLSPTFGSGDVGLSTVVLSFHYVTENLEMVRELQYLLADREKFL